MLYTGKGDNGTTKLFGCTERIAKTEIEIEALGALDELNSLLGVCRAHGAEATISVNDMQLPEFVRLLQEDLFVLQAQVARAPKELAPERLVAVERAIAEIERRIPPPGGFIISGGDELEALFDYARAVSRRTERALIAAKAKHELTHISYRYMNRLSSMLYALARLTSHEKGIKEQHPSY